MLFAEVSDITPLDTHQLTFLLRLDRAAAMANFARSFKSPSFLSPRHRPPMTSRTFSNSSDLSLSSNHSGPSDDASDLVLSAPGTPALLSPALGGGEQLTSNPLGGELRP